MVPFLLNPGLTISFSVEIVTVGNMYPNAPGAIPFVGPAFETAVADLRQKYGAIFEVKHTYLVDRKYANAVELAFGIEVMTASWYYDRERTPANLTVLIFGGSNEAYPLNRLAESWKTLMITSVVNGPRDRRFASTWISGSCVSVVTYERLFQLLLTKYGWRSVYIVLDVSSNLFYTAMSGSLVYIAVEIFQHPQFGSFSWRYEDKDDDLVKEAYRSVLLLGPDESMYDIPSVKLIQEWKDRTRTLYNFTYTDNNPYVVASYTSVMMFGALLNETLAGSMSTGVQNGITLASKFLNRTFDLSYTTIFIDGSGERRTDLVVRDLDISTGIFEPKLLLSKNKNAFQRLGDIDWSSRLNIPPPNEPECGYRDNRVGKSCSQGGTTNLIAGVMVILLATVVCVAAWVR
ncbi:hypothetical protein BV898_02141 [Hypsibius exemplaris]|uniref:Receptor ligand binding region domain-containing protein n=1 Tax=Hypsibius exemplaris TaxID=2072580 RepID=A0A1W0X9X0_HYPEX|nr:hypothetical protein BV898_02141 [Hypsibius exemplaris]